MKYNISGVLHAPISAEIEADSFEEARDLFIQKAYEEIYTTGDNGIATQGGRDSDLAIDGVALSEKSIEVEHD